MASGVYMSNYLVLAKYILFAQTGSITANFPLTLYNGYYGAATTAPATVNLNGTPSGRNDNVNPGSGSFFNAAITQLTQLKAALDGLTTTVPNYTGSTQTVTLGPGVYDTVSAINFTGPMILNLDAGGDSTAQFIFRANGAINFANVSAVNLINSAIETNVFWWAGSTISLNGTIASIPGVFVSSTSISFANPTQINGRMFAGDSITLATGSTLYINPTNPKINFLDYPNLRNYALLSGEGINFVFPGPTGIQNGYYGASGAITGSVVPTGAISGRKDNTTGDSALFNAASQEFIELKDDLRALLPRETSFNPANRLTNLIFPGVYSRNTEIEFRDNIASSPITIILDATGDPNAQFIFLSTGEFVFRNVVAINLAGGALAENVFWIAPRMDIRGSPTILGTFIADTNGPSYFGDAGTRQTIDGRIFSNSEVYFAGTINLAGDIPCYLKGTQILTDRGYVSVELIQEGDKVVTFADIDSDMVVTLREPSLQSCVSLRVHTVSNPPVKSRPIFFKAGSFGYGLPDRDLYLSRNHGVYFTNHLRQARFLVNGETILPELECKKLEYYHLELESHVCIKANGILAESLNIE